jgi:hypothetical protein
MTTTRSWILLATIAAIAALAGCGAHGKLRADSPVIEYRAPDISEITGVEEPDASEADTGSAAK